MQPSSIPVLFAIQCIFLIGCARSAVRASQATTAAVLVSVSLLTWGCFSSWFALSGVYDSPEFLELMPGLWLSVVPVVIVAMLIVLFPFVRRGLMDVAMTTSHHRLIGIQAFRVLAIGTLIKTVRNVFPLHIELAIGITDFAFGIASWAIYGAVKRGRISSDALVLFHAVGLLIILLPAQIAIQAGLPGPLQKFSEAPTSEVMFDFPMVLAPSLVVPIFLMLNLLGILAAAKQGEANVSKRSVA